MDSGKSKLQCPGQDLQRWKPDDIFTLLCPVCENEIEFWKDDVTRTCDLCEQVIPNPKLDLGCAQWCRYSKECLSLISEGKKQMINHLGEGVQEAIRLAQKALFEKGVVHAATTMGIEVTADGKIPIQVFNCKYLIDSNTLQFTSVSDEPVHPTDELLSLRYLSCDNLKQPKAEWISFRDLPGGSFYYEPAAGRTTKLLLKIFQNNIESLKTALQQYPHVPVVFGDFAAEIEAIGILKMLLIYHLGDEEFPPSIDLLYDGRISSVYHTDEVAALATRLCVGLVRAKSIR